MASFSSSSNNIPYNPRLGFKPSFLAQTLPNLINDLRTNESNDEIKLSVLNDYLCNCQKELFIATVFKQELPQNLPMILNGMEILKEEIERIEKGMEPTVVAESSMNVSATEENTNSKNKQPVDDLDDHIIENDEQTNQPNVVAESSMNFSATEENTNSENKQPVDDLDDPIIENDEQTNQAAKCVLEIISSVMDIKRRPLTQPIWKNGRVLWTSELHERFVATLNLLGGPEVAKPSQIRECIKVDGLTTDQVKSYLQNYRQTWRSERYAAEIEDAAENEDVAEDEE